MNKPVVALGRDLMGSLFDLPKKAQRHATTFLTKFQTNPRSSGINLERIANAADEKLYSARIDQRYRAIIAFQKSSNVYVLLYVGDHDDAYKWAETKNSTSTRTRGPSSCTIWFLKRKSTRQCVKIPRAKLGGRAPTQSLLSLILLRRSLFPILQKIMLA